MCENHGGLQPNGHCAEDEYCAGPNTLEDSVCGKKHLCTKKGNSEICFPMIHLKCGNYSIYYILLSLNAFVFIECFKSSTDEGTCGKKCTLCVCTLSYVIVSSISLSLIAI